MASNFSPSIKTAYFYVFSAIGVILLVVGIFKLSDYAVKKVFLDTYYLPYEAGRCGVPKQIGEDAEQTKINEDYRAQCEKDLIQERKIREVSDVSSSITFIVIGLILFVFHYRRARALS